MTGTSTIEAAVRDASAIDTVAIDTAVIEAVAVDTLAQTLSAALAAVSSTQREIDALHARRARELVAVVAAARAAETAPLASQREEFARRSARAEIALALGVGERTADRCVSEAETLIQDVPRVLVAVETGVVAWPAARTIALEAMALASRLRGEHGAPGPEVLEAAREALSRFEEGAIELARRVPPSRLRGRLETLRERIHPVAAEVRHASARSERHLWLEDVQDGMSWLHAYLPAVEAHAVVHRLDGIARAARDFDAEERIVDPRTLEQRRVDLLVDLLLGDDARIGDADAASTASGRADHGGADCGRADRGRIASGEPGSTSTSTGRDVRRFAGIRPTVVVTVPVQTLLPRTDGLPDPVEPAMLDGIVPIDPATARALAGQATTFFRLLVDPHTGARLDLSRERYQVPASLRLWLQLRDEHCRFPGCGRPVRGCDIDHTVDWQYGGETRADNLAHLCRGHHTLKHQTSWRVAQDAGALLTWQAPSGAFHETQPPSAFLRSG